LIGPPRKKDSKKIITYNNITGMGRVDHHPFKFKNHQPEFRLFSDLYDNMNTAVPFERVKVLIGGESHSWSQRITTLVTKIKRRTKLTKDDIVQNNGSLTLIGEKKTN
jgi:hypothetical protein